MIYINHSAGLVYYFLCPLCDCLSLFIQDVLVHIVFILHWFGTMVGFLVSGSVIWPAFERESANAELGVAVDWSTIESASLAAGVSHTSQWS